MARNLGTVFVELSLDDKVYKQKLSETLTSTEATAKGIETSWKVLGARNDATYDAQRRSYENAMMLIKNSATSTTQDIIRAEEAKNRKLEELNKQQYGSTVSMLDNIKKNWAMMAAGAAASLYVIEKAYRTMMKAVEWGEAGAKIERTEAAFKSVASAAGLSSEEVIRAMKAASRGMMDDSDIMVKASRLIQEGIPIQTLTDLMGLLVKQAPIVGDTLPEAWEKFGQALATGKLKGVQSYIGLVDLEDEYKKVAAASGNVGRELDDQSKMMVTADVVTRKLAEATRGLGEHEETASEKITKAKVAMQNAHEEMLKQWIPIATTYYGIMAAVLETWNSLSNRTPPDWVLKQEGKLGAGASGSWGPDLSKFSIDKSLSLEQPGTALKFKEDANAIKEATKRLDEYRKIVIDLGTEDWQKAEKAYEDYAKTNAEDLKTHTDLTIKYYSDEWEKVEKGYDQFYADRTKGEDETAKEIRALLADEDKYREEIWANEKKRSDDVWKVERAIYKDIARLTNDDFDLRRTSIQEQAELYEKQGANRVAVEKWVALQLREIDEEEALRKGTFWDGMQVAYQRDIRNQQTWAQQGLKVWEGIFGRGGALQNVTKSFYEDFLNGELKKGTDYFKQFQREINSIFADLLSDLTRQWIRSGIMAIFEKLGLGGGTGLNTGTGLNVNVGGTSVLGTVADKGLSALSSLSSGAIPSSMAGLGVQASSLMSTGALINLGGDVTSTVGAGAAGASGASGAGAASGAAAVAAPIAAYAAVAALILMGLSDKGTGHHANLAAPATGWQTELGASIGSAVGVADMSAVYQNRVKSLVASDPYFSQEAILDRYYAAKGYYPSTHEQIFHEAWPSSILGQHYYGVLNQAQAIAQEWQAAKEQSDLEYGLAHGVSTNPYEMAGGAAEGGIITGPMMAINRLGQSWPIGEKGPEYFGNGKIIPMKTGSIGESGEVRLIVQNLKVILDGEEVKGRMRVVADKVYVDRKRSGIGDETRVYQ